ncbi:NahK/ErcS family hybrid sensor histidine kinase/response regulator [Telmatospirillum sp. J64-1]|uniref:NahK/ErcS family hybrid sensor histidine kinase/response regulator n=1 Tax=Telmatospirillum sp. J64-1 TaxID=2502183 RepID=UPI00115DB268|nr:NahK/ErcS family hybrid sensor histidine kinase/response regulator [Telmatospirillum sp. J64-1]
MDDFAPQPHPVTAEDRLAELERENAKLRKINKALMDRVERSMDYQGNAFSLFQTAILLESKVRERTMALESALRELERSNGALSLAKEEEETAKARLSEAIEAISEGFVLTDGDDRLVLFNSKFREMWPGADGIMRPGLGFEDMLRKAVQTGQVADAQDDPTGWLERRLAHHRAPGELFVMQFKDGRWVQVSERRTADGGIVGIYTDITEIKISEKRRRERELAQKSVLLQATLDNLSQGVCVFDAEQRLTAWNERFIDLLGLDRDLARPGMPLSAFLDAEAMAAAERDEAVPLLTEHACRDGRVLEIHRNAMPGGGFVATFTDITGRKQSEEALRDSERRLRLITDAMPALIAYVDGEERYSFTNKAYEEWFGRPRSEINGSYMREVLGEELYNKRSHYIDVVMSGQACSFEMTLPVKERHIQYALATYVPHMGAHGEVLGFFALIQDITERRLADEQLREAKETLERRVKERTAELSAANAALREAKTAADQANLSKTKFLAAASHDLLQPLNAARVFATALSERRLSATNRALAENTVSALEAVDELLNALLDISKLDAGVLNAQPVDFNVDSLLAAMAAEHVLQARAKGLSLKVRPCSCVLRSDQRLLGRILRNFISNAIRYTPRGRILVGCRRQDDGLLIGVWDTGIGIPEDKLGDIFEEFRRLQNDSREKGMGLGLAIVERICRKLGHRIVVRSVPGRGSMFGVVVPYGDSLTVQVRDDLSPVHRGNNLAGALVLVLDNDAKVLSGMSALLEGWSCDVLSASSRAEALALLEADGRRPELLIVDYHLDEGDIGLDAIAALQSRLGGRVPAIVVTANHTPEVQSAVSAAGWHLLNKPIKPAKLRSLMAHLLAGRVRMKAKA